MFIKTYVFYQHFIIFMFIPMLTKNTQIVLRLHSLHGLTAKYFMEMHFQDRKRTIKGFMK